MKHINDWLYETAGEKEIEFEVEDLEHKEYLVNNIECLDDQIFAECWLL